MSVLQEAGHIKNIVVWIFRLIQCLHLTDSEAGCVLVSSATQVHPQIIFNPDFSDYISVSYSPSYSRKWNIFVTKHVIDQNFANFM